jgi:Ala-tRNA(Pro) deacylase
MDEETAMLAGEARLYALLDELGITHSTIEHPAAYTVGEAQAVRGLVPGAHTKNLFLKDKKSALFLVTALEDTPIDLKRLHETIGAKGRLSFGSAERLVEALGVTPGSVTPLALINDTARVVTFILDERLARHDLVNVHPLRNTATTTLAMRDFLVFLERTGHPPRVLELPG